MRVLIACEESQRITIEYRKLGVEAFSCDIKECSGSHPEWHIKGDVIEHLKTVEAFYYDLIIAHPPCTYLSCAGALNFYDRTTGAKNEARFEQQREAVKFFMFFYNFNGCKRVCIENPRPMKCAGLPPHSQVIQPYDFGDDWSKQTLLWLRGLPYLFPSVIVKNRRSAAPSWTGANRSATMRSKTFTGIARAMAQQWRF